MNQYRVYQASVIITVTWGPENGKRLPWCVCKLLDPDTLKPEAAEITSHVTPAIPITSGKARIIGRDWVLAANIAYHLDRIFVSHADFQNVTVQMVNNSITTTYFTVSGRAGSKRTVTIHTPR